MTDWLRFSNPTAAKPASDATIRRVFEVFDAGEPGLTSGLVAEELSLSTAQVSKIAKWCAAKGLLYDTGYAMKFERGRGWQYIERPKTEGGMITKPGASTQWLVVSEYSPHNAAHKVSESWNDAQRAMWQKIEPLNPRDRGAAVRARLEELLK